MEIMIYHVTGRQSSPSPPPHPPPTSRFPQLFVSKGRLCYIDVIDDKGRLDQQQGFKEV